MDLFSNKNKTEKNNNKTKRKYRKTKCKRFCKKDYLPEINKRMKQVSEKQKIPYQPPTDKDKKLYYKGCKKSFCNRKCKGYDFFGDKIRQKEFQANIKDGFENTFSEEQIRMLKKKGALSGCLNMPDYDVLHDQK